MGNKRNRLKRFLAEHPKCCFCGGTNAATTEDHWPSRAVFDERKWPNGYVFPACQACNAATAEDEALFALVCRLSPKEFKPEQSVATYKLMLAVSERLPHIYQSFFPSANKIRQWLREQGQTLAPGQTTKDIPMFSLEHPELRERIKNCATKLFLSLHYRHTGNVLPNQGGVFLVWYSNANTTDEVPTEIFEPFTTQFPNLKWQNLDLSDQFRYRYDADLQGTASVFHVVFHESIGMIGLIFHDLTKLTTEIPNDLILRPYNRKHNLAASAGF